MYEWILDFLLIRVDELYAAKSDGEILGGYIKSSNRIYRIYHGVPIIYPTILHRHLRKVISAYRRIPPNTWRASRSDWFRHLRRQQAELIIHGLGYLIGSRNIKKLNILSVGCGSGWELWLIREYLQRISTNIRFRAVGIDISLKALFEAKIVSKALSARNIDFICAPAEFLPFKDAIFDVVLAVFGALDHSIIFPRAFKEISRVLRPNGIFIGTVLNKFALDWIFKVLSSFSLFVKTLRYANRPFAKIRVPIRQGYVRIPTHFYTIFELDNLLRKNSLRLIYLKGIFSTLPMDFKSKRFSILHKFLAGVDYKFSSAPILRSVGRYIGFIAEKI